MMDKKTPTNKLEPAPRTMPQREDVIGFSAIREDGLIEINTWCTFGDIADFVMEQIEKKNQSKGDPK